MTPAAFLAFCCLLLILGPQLFPCRARAGQPGALLGQADARADSAASFRWHLGVRFCRWRRCLAAGGGESGKVFAFPRDSCSASSGPRKPFAPCLSSKTSFSLFLHAILRLDANYTLLLFMVILLYLLETIHLALPFSLPSWVLWSLSLVWLRGQPAAGLLG